jgi:WD40 repeat protein
MVASSSSRAPLSNSILGVVERTATNAKERIWITTGSEITAFDLKSGEIQVKIGHRDDSPVGTGRALNADEVVCLLPLGHSNNKIATGWVDGTVRIFEVLDSDRYSPHSLLMDDDEDDEMPALLQREPLVLSGHTGTPVRSLANFQHNRLLLASGGSDGKIILWDLVAETGLFRLLGHRNAVTDLCFVTDTLLISCSLDGLSKVWDLKAQCCTQTLASHRGEVWAGACQNLRDHSNEESDADRWRLLTGGSDGRVRVWSVETNNKNDNPDEICQFMGTLLPPPNVAVSNEKLSCLHFHRNGRYVGVLHSNSKHVDVYLIRNIQESQKKRQRRLKRRQEKQKKKTMSDQVNVEKGKKRGILDDPESSSSSDDDDHDDHRMENEQPSPEALKASDEFEYIGSVRCSHKVRGFDFVPKKDKSELLRIVCALTTNSLEIHSLVRTKERYVRMKRIPSGSSF